MRDNAKGGALTEVTFFILLSLYTPKHGYAVMQFIEDNTKGRLTLGAGTLYGALNSLQEKGWIAPFGDSAGRKKEYLITTQGKEIAEKELIRLNELVGVANGIIGVLQTKVNRKNEKSSAKFTRPKKGITKQAGEESHRQPG